MGRGGADKLLRTVRARSLKVGWGTTLGEGLGTALFILGVTSLAMGIIPESWRIWSSGVALCVAFLLGIARAVYRYRSLKPRISLKQAAELLTNGDGGKADLLLSGADIDGWGESGAAERHVSPVLAKSAVDESGRYAAMLYPKRAVRLRPLVMSFVLLAVGAGFLWSAERMTGHPLSDSLWILSLGGNPDPVSVGNVIVTVSPPGYTGIETYRIEGGDGSVEGYPGTRVTVEGAISERIDSGVWFGPKGKRIGLDVDDSGVGFKVSWTLEEPGAYGLAFARQELPVPSDFGEKHIALLADEPPKATMLHPTEDVETLSSEDVEVVFEGKDDFEILRAELSVSGDEEVRIPLNIDPDRKVSGSVRFLPAAHPELGDGASVRVDVFDNDVVGGPRLGMSRSVYVTFLDRRKILSELENMEERLFETLILHLGDHLELDMAEERSMKLLREGARDIIALLDGVARMLDFSNREGGLGRLAALKIDEGLRRVLKPLAQNAHVLPGLIEEVERDILFLDELLRNLRMEDALSMGDELAALQRDLFDRIEAGEDMRELMDAVERIQRELARMMEKLDKSRDTMPETFANSDAVKEQQESGVDELLKELRKALDEGDREKAAELAERLLDRMMEMMASLEEAASMAGMQQADPAMEMIEEARSMLDSAMGAQEELLSKTSERASAAAKRVAEELKDAMQDFIKRQRERLGRVNKSGGQMARELTSKMMHSMPVEKGMQNAMSEALEASRLKSELNKSVSAMNSVLAEDLGMAAELAESLDEIFSQLERKIEKRAGTRMEPEKILESGRDGREALNEILAEFRELAESRKKGVTEEENEELWRMAGVQKDVEGQLAEIEAKLKKASREIPQMGQGPPIMAGKAKNSSRSASNKLGGGDPFGAMKSQRQSMDQMGELARQLDEISEQMGEGQQQGMSMMPKPGQRSGRGTEVDRSRVEIPAERESRELEEFRSDVMKAMRDAKVPRGFEGEVQRYFQGLIK